MRDSLPPATRYAPAAAAAFLLLVAAASSAYGQSLPPQRVKEIGSSGNQKQVRELGKKTSDSTYMSVRMEQVNEDFEHLKSANNDILKMTSGRSEMSYRRIAELSTGVKARGEHLRSALALPEPEKEKGKDAAKDEVKGPNAEQMKPYLMALADLITSFVTNPIFKSEKEVNEQLAAQARRDLEELIALSTQIRKSAERLDKERAR